MIPDLTTYVALIRGINLAGHNRVRMADLRAALEAAGHAGAQTYLQSGNVVLRSGSSAERVARDVAAATGLDVPVMIRSAEQIAAVVAANPYPEVEDGKTLHVAFLDGRPRLPEGDFAPEAFTLRGTELYVWLPGGMRDSKLVKVLGDRALGVGSTWRNWNTVRALHELSAA